MNNFLEVLRKMTVRREHDQDKAQSACLIPPENLNNIKLLGEGQYGIVMMGEWRLSPGDVKTKRKYVAIKSLKDTTDGNWLKRIFQEAHTMQRLSHDNIVKFYGMSYPPGDDENCQLLLVTEFAQFGSLDDNFKKKTKNVCFVSNLCKFATQVANGMNYLASQNWVHRDLSTRNILLFADDVVKISDFGLARSLEDDGTKMVSLLSPLAVPLMPPEVLNDRVFTSASDVWSYGVTLWEMFSFGEKPWAELSVDQIHIMTIHDGSRRLQRPRACPEGYYELLMLKTWETKPEHRPTFKYIVEEIIPTLQPRQVATKVSHEAKELSHLSFAKGEKVTVISRLNNGMVLAQHENCAIGLIDAKHLKIGRKGSNSPAALSINGPFNVKEIHSPKSPEETEEVERFHLTLAGKHRAGTFNDLVIDESEDSLITDHTYDTLRIQEPEMNYGASPGAEEKDSVESMLSWRLSRYKRPRAKTETEILKATSHCAQGYKEEFSGQQETSWNETTPPAGERTDGKCDKSAAFGRCDGASRRGPVPTPRRPKTVQKSFSVPEGSISPWSVCEGADPTKSNDFVEEDSDSTVIPTEGSEKHMQVKNAGDNHLTAVEEPEQVAEADLKFFVSGNATDTGDQGSASVSSAFHPTTLSFKASGNSELKKQTGIEPGIEKHIDLSSQQQDYVPPVPPKKRTQDAAETWYQYPQSIPVPHHTGPGTRSRINQPLSRPPFIPSTAASETGHRSTVGLHALNFGISTANRPVDTALNRPAVTTNPVSSVIESGDPLVKPFHPKGAVNEGSHEAIIDSIILKIQEECGEDVDRDWCSAALGQCQGDLEAVFDRIKAEKLSTLTGKSVEFCVRTLSHYSRDLDRAALYIFENFQEKER